ncbi:efflux RND transporter periplasmic adaptor subunit [Leptolyngbya sp. AN02str]|uniref:efflux RND transporter periplasmic adaptor subunit n=1 Tax=Leptolyngbya sp. AN02str TaxID=3423363 RepID=UPI003D317553
MDEAAAAATQDTSVVAAQQVANAAVQVSAQTQIIETLTRRLQELRSLRGTLTLRATTSGTVITSDLDLRVGQELRPDTALMQIAELGSLTANVEIPEEDLDYVEMNAPVTFRPRQAKLETYTARVEDILYNVEPDKTEQRRVATVRLIIDNPDNRLRPGSSGYARIFSEWIPLYERAGREILKLIPERFL